MLLVAATHVVVDHTPLTRVSIDNWPGDSWWFKFSAIFTAAAALFAAAAAGATFYLALITRALALATQQMATKTADLATETAIQVKETKDAIDQTERHHQQSFMPILTFRANCRMGPGADGNVHLVIDGEVKNVGPGPALSVYLYIKPVQYVPKRIFLGLISGNSSLTLSNRIVKYGPGDLMGLNSAPFDSLLRYQTIFGTQGAMWETSHSGLVDDVTIGRHIIPSPDNEAQVTELFQRDWASFSVG